MNICKELIKYHFLKRENTPEYASWLDQFDNAGWLKYFTERFEVDSNGTMGYNYRFTKNNENVAIVVFRYFELFKVRFEYFHNLEYDACEVGIDSKTLKVVIETNLNLEIKRKIKEVIISNLKLDIV